MLTALHVATKEGRADACRMLLRAGACCLEEMTVREIQKQGDRDGPLMLMCVYVSLFLPVPGRHTIYLYMM